MRIYPCVWCKYTYLLGLLYILNWTKNSPLNKLIIFRWCSHIYLTMIEWIGKSHSISDSSSTGCLETPNSSNFDILIWKAQSPHYVICLLILLSWFLIPVEKLFSSILFTWRTNYECEIMNCLLTVIDQKSEVGARNKRGPLKPWETSNRQWSNLILVGYSTAKPLTL